MLCIADVNLSHAHEKKEGVMIFKRLGRMIVSLALAGLILGSSAMANSVVLAGNGYVSGQDRDWGDRRPNREERERFRREERDEMRRIREMDREHRLRYRMNNRVRTVGFFDGYGNYHQYGYYDRWGFFHRY